MSTKEDMDIDTKRGEGGDPVVEVSSDSTSAEGGFSRMEEKRLLRKLDWSLLPCLAMMYLCNALDKGNLGNAKTVGIDKDLHLVGNQYYLIVMVFYGELFFIRILLGIFESAMLPGVVFYLSTFYTRIELAGRVGIFYSAAQISAAIAYVYLPLSPATHNLLTPREKEICRMRTLKDSSAIINEKVNVRDAFMPFMKDWRYCIWALQSIGLGDIFLQTWYNNNSPSENKRVVLTAVMVGFANSSGLISSNVFEAKDAPK
ncbi:hypothetical protein RQP46_003086 [Phenoliferia psychrophenolica]